jgi:hypothetical protein
MNTMYLIEYINDRVIDQWFDWRQGMARSLSESSACLAADESALEAVTEGALICTGCTPFACRLVRLVVHFSCS